MLIIAPGNIADLGRAHIDAFRSFVADVEINQIAVVPFAGDKGDALTVRRVFGADLVSGKAVKAMPAPETPNRARRLMDVVMSGYSPRYCR